MEFRREYLKQYLPTKPVTPKTAEPVLAETLAKMRDDPLGGALYLWGWGAQSLAGCRLEDWQFQTYIKLRDHLQNPLTRHHPFRLAIASGHGIGKSAFLSQMQIIMLSTFPMTRCIVTANTEGQLRTKTWPELAKWHQLALNSHWFEYTKTALISKDVNSSENWRSDAVTWSLTNTDAFAGAHNQGKRLFEAFDEASQIPKEIFEVTEGAMSDKNTQLIWLAFGNPTQLSGPFYDCFHSPKSRWQTLQIDSRTVTITNKDELDGQIGEHGEDSDFVRIRIRGMFPRSSINQAIPREWVDKAAKRVIKHQSEFDYAPCIVGIDGSWTGDDPLAVYVRQGNYCKRILVLNKNDNDIQTAGKIVGAVRQLHPYPVDAWILDQGYGTGIYSALKVMGFKKVFLVPFGGSSPDPGFANMRTYIWREMGLWLRDGGVIQDDVELEQELGWPEMHTVPSGKRAGWAILESKKDMAARGLKSPNMADALAVTFSMPIQKKAGKWPSIMDTRMFEDRAGEVDSRIGKMYGYQRF
jgi:hypothetical protein